MNAAHVVKDLVKWLKGHLKATKSKGFVVGMSGGIDSSVVAALAHQASEGATVGLIMPCASDPQDQQYALEVAQLFKINTVVVDLNHAFSILHQEMHTILMNQFRVKTGDLKIPAGNLKPRLRMMTLYFYANALTSMVVGTGNKSEACMGYFTKYGDGGVDLLPLGGLLKTEVRSIAGALGIPHSVVMRAPTAGLWEGQTDEGEMGMTYEALDRAIRAIEGRRDHGVSVPRQDMVKVRRIMKATAHKRSPIPVFTP